MSHPHHLNIQPRCLQWLLLASALVSSSSAIADSKDWHFEVLLDDAKIGHHSFSVRKQGDNEIMESKAEFNVKFLFFNAYSYKHSNVETWQGNCLLGITSSTDDNGMPYSVSSMRQDDQLIIVAGNERSALPACPMSFAYWKPEILNESRLLNSQTGEYLPVQIRDLGEQRLEVNGQAVRTDRYQIEAKDMRIQLWYSKEGEWLALQSATESGRTIRYRLIDGNSLAEYRQPRPGET